MAKSFDITMIGSKELQKKFKGITPKLQRLLLVRAMRKAAKPVLETAKQLIPKDTGAAELSLGIDRARRIRGGGAMVTISTSIQKLVGEQSLDAEGRSLTGGKTKVYLYSYPIALEMGTSKMAPQPYLRPALKQNQGIILRSISDDIRDGLHKLEEE